MADASRPPPPPSEPIVAGKGANDVEQAQEKTKKPPDRKRISNEDKEDCYKFFETHNFHINSKLPRAGTQRATDLQIFMGEKGLSKSQITLQLKNWKFRKFHFGGESFETDPEKLREQVTANMPTANDEFIKDEVIESMLNKEDKVAGLSACLNPETLPFYKFMQSEDGSSFVQLLSDILDKYVDYLVEAIPSKARLCKKGEEIFQKRRYALKYTEKSRFLEMVNSFEFPTKELRILKKDFGEKRWSFLFLDLETKLHHHWSRTRFLADRKPIQIATECVVSKFALGMVYFTAGVLLRKIGNPKNTKIKNRQKISEAVFQKHSIGQFHAKQAGLPIHTCVVSFGVFFLFAFQSSFQTG